MYIVVTYLLFKKKRIHNLLHFLLLQTTHTSSVETVTINEDVYYLRKGKRKNIKFTDPTSVVQMISMSGVYNLPDVNIHLKLR